MLGFNKPSAPEPLVVGGREWPMVCTSQSTNMVAMLMSSAGDLVEAWLTDTSTSDLRYPAALVGNERLRWIDE